MSRAAAATIPRYDFLRNKYGPELLLDVGRLESLPNFVLDDTPHSLSFYDVMFITQGAGQFNLDQVCHEIGTGSILFTSPGQVRRWQATQPVQGYTLFFEEGFITSFFQDPLFLHRFRFFHHPSGALSLRAQPQDLAQFVRQLEAINQEFKQLQQDSPHMLRALLYQLLVQLNRLYGQQHHTEADTQGHPLIFSFRKLLEDHFRQKHQVQEYASLLHISPAHLNDLTQRYFGSTASALIKDRLLTQAKRELLYTPKTVSEIAFELHFSDTANFNRFFKGHCGLTPKAFRAQAF